MSILNPYVLLGILVAMLSAYGGGYYKGGQDEFAKQQMEIARLNQEARQKEQALVTAVQRQATELVKANKNAKVVIQSVILTSTLVLCGCGFLSKRPPAQPYQPPQMPPLPSDLTPQQPNFSQRLLEIFSPSQTKPTSPPESSTPVSPPTTKSER